MQEQAHLIGAGPRARGAIGGEMSIGIQLAPLFGTRRNDSTRPGAAVRLAQPGRVRWRDVGL